MLILADRLGEAVEKQLHRLGVHVGQDQREGIVRAGFDSREDVGEREALVGNAARSLAALPPDVACAALLADARFILEEQAYRLFNSTTD